MNHLKGNVHAELCCVAAIEGSHTFIDTNSSGTVNGTTVRSVVHLETLFYNCQTEEKRKERNEFNSPTTRVLYTLLLGG